MFVQFGVGARVFAGDALFFQADWCFRFRLADRLPETWQVGAVVVGYRF